MSEILSQDQLDDLLKMSDLSGDVSDIDETSDGESSGGKDYGVLASAFDFFNKKSGEVISSVLNRTVTLTVGKCEQINVDELKKSVPSPLLMLTLKLEGGIDASMYLLLTTKTVAMLADLMLMGDGTAEYCDDHKDAISELFSQVMGAYSTGLAEYVDSGVSAGPIDVSEFDFDSPPFDLADSDMVLINVDLGDGEPLSVGFIVPDAMSSEFIKYFGSNVSGSTDDSLSLESSDIDDISNATSDFGAGNDSGGFQGNTSGSVSASKENVDMLLDVDLDVSIELGRADLSIKRILELAPGSIVELDRLAGEPVDLLVNDRVVAKGEVVVVDENFGIRIVSLVSPEERIKILR